MDFALLQLVNLGPTFNICISLHFALSIAIIMECFLSKDKKHDSLNEQSSRTDKTFVHMGNCSYLGQAYIILSAPQVVKENHELYIPQKILLLCGTSIFALHSVYRV